VAKNARRCNVACYIVVQTEKHGAEREFSSSIHQ
jgi:hypothetical protein